MSRITVHLVEKYYYEVEIEAEDFVEARELFYDNHNEIMNKQIPDRSKWNDYSIEAYEFYDNDKNQCAY